MERNGAVTTTGVSGLAGLAVIALLLCAAPAAAQPLEGADRWADSVRVEIHAALVRGDVEALVAAGALAERALAAFPGDPLLLHYRGYAVYREAVLRRERQGEDVGALLDEAQSLLERSAELLPLPETYAVLASVLGQKIGSNPLRAMILGPKSGAALDRALELGPQNPRVWLTRGISAIFTPKLFGGGLERAEEALRQALAHFETDSPAPPAPAWGHDEAWAWLGEVYRRTDRHAEAREAYMKALEIEPENYWVRHVLLPALDKASGGP